MENRAKKTVVVRTAQEWNALDSTVSFVVVESHSCNELNMRVLDLSRLTGLQELSIGDYCFENVNEVVVDGLVNLKRMVIGSNSCIKKSGVFMLTNCSSLEELRFGNYSFASYSSLVIEDVPMLEELVIRSNSFLNVDMVNLIELEGLKKVVIGENAFMNREGEFALKDCLNVAEVIMGSGSMRLFNQFEIDGTPSLETIRIGDDCFANVNEMHLDGLSGLKKLMVGSNSFTLKKNGYGNDPTRHFSVKNCPKLKSLNVGRYSFSDYSACVIEGVNALEAITVGDLNEKSCNFYAASLELKGQS